MRGPSRGRFTFGLWILTQTSADVTVRVLALTRFCPYFLSDICLSRFRLSRFCPQYVSVRNLVKKAVRCLSARTFDVLVRRRLVGPPLKISSARKSRNYDPIRFVTLSIVQRWRRFDKWRIFEQNSRTNRRRNDCCKYHTFHRKLTTKYDFRFNSFLKMVMTLWISIRYQIVWQ